MTLRSRIGSTASNSPTTRRHILKRLADTYVYKVGHHGSTNATPQTLFKDFANKKTNPNADPDKIMTSVVSTMGDENGKFKHGNPDKGTEVSAFETDQRVESGAVG